MSSGDVDQATEVRRRTSATVEEVHAVLADGWLYPSWVVGASRARGVDPSWPAVGAQLHHSVGLWPVLLDDTTQVTEAEPPHHLRLRARGRPFGEASVEFRLEPSADGAGCVIRLREDATRGPGRHVPLAARAAVVRLRNRETLRRLALLAEGKARNARAGTGQPLADPRKDVP